MQSSKIHRARGNARSESSQTLSAANGAIPAKAVEPKRDRPIAHDQECQVEQLEEGPLANHDQCPVVRHETVAVGANA